MEWDKCLREDFYLKEWRGGLKIEYSWIFTANY